MNNRIYRMSDTQTVCVTLEKALELGSDNSVLFVSPHDDDAAIGAGMLINLLVRVGVQVHVAVVTDGRMGYFRSEFRNTIVGVRRDETVRAYRLLGVPESQVHFLGFPDGNTWSFLGRRLAQPGEPSIEGHTGLENHLTWVVRQVKPKIIVTAALEDIHPDHKAVAMAVPIVRFHASNGIWPELGPAIPEPRLMEYPVYRQPTGNPVLAVCSDEAFEQKLTAIAAWGTQTEIIAGIMKDVVASGPVEYIWERRETQYKPHNFTHLIRADRGGVGD